MNNNFFLNGLQTLPLLCDEETRTINAENPRGEKGAGGKAASVLGPGRKGSPCITLPAGQTVTLAEIEGTGVIQHVSLWNNSRQHLPQRLP